MFTRRMMVTHTHKIYVRLFLRTVYLNTHPAFPKVPWLYLSHFAFFTTCRFPSRYASFPPLCNVFTAPLASPIYLFVAVDESGWISSTHSIDTTMSLAPWINRPVWPNGSLRVACVPTTVSRPQLDSIPSHQQLVLRRVIHIFSGGLCRVESNRGSLRGTTTRTKMTIKWVLLHRDEQFFSMIYDR